MKPCRVNMSCNTQPAAATPPVELVQRPSIEEEKLPSSPTATDHAIPTKAIDNALALAEKQTIDSSTQTDNPPHQPLNAMPTLQPPPPALTLQLPPAAPTHHPTNPTPTRERIPLSRPFEPQHCRDTKDDCGICLLAPFALVGFIVLLFVLIFGKKPYGSAFSSRETST